MTRSRKKPVYTDQQGSRGSKSTPSRSVGAKRAANKAVRQANKKAAKGVVENEVVSGKGYRKVSDSWDIRDWAFWSPKDKRAYRK